MLSHFTLERIGPRLVGFLLKNWRGSILRSIKSLVIFRLYIFLTTDRRRPSIELMILWAGSQPLSNNKTQNFSSKRCLGLTVFRISTLQRHIPVKHSQRTPQTRFNPKHLLKFTQGGSRDWLHSSESKLFNNNSKVIVLLVQKESFKFFLCFVDLVAEPVFEQWSCLYH